VSLFGARRHPRTAALPLEGHLPSFDGATDWLNSSPLTPAELRGRVVLVDFWTYTCINWLRTLAFVRAWDAKCRDLGLDVIGVHTPEFSPSRSALAARGRERRIGRSRLTPVPAAFVPPWHTSAMRPPALSGPVPTTPRTRYSR
jgi:hypothetical protein